MSVSKIVQKGREDVSVLRCRPSQDVEVDEDLFRPSALGETDEVTEQQSHIISHRTFMLLVFTSFVPK